MITAWWILLGWVASLDGVVELIAGRFGRVEPRRRVGAYLRGLLAGLERKNGWTLAEHAGAVSPDGMQRLLRTADWDVDGVRDDLRGYGLDALGDESGVFIIDETGFIKKGVRSAGVQRPVHRYQRKDRQLSVGGVPGLRVGTRAGVDRSRALSSEVMDRRPGPVRRGRDSRRHRVRDQARAGHRHARPRAHRRDPERVGDRG